MAPAIPPATGSSTSVPATTPAVTTAVAANKGRLTVDVPADAKVYIDDQLMKTTDKRRTYETPTLEAGETYFYVIRMEVVRDGKTHSETKRVTIRAGEESKASFQEPAAVASAVAGSSARR